MNRESVLFRAGDELGRLELPMPELGKGEHSLASTAKDMEKRIKAQTPPELRDSVAVKTFRKGGRTGLAIEFDDRAEKYVYVAIEYPAGAGHEEYAVPRTTKE